MYLLLLPPTWAYSRTCDRAFAYVLYAWDFLPLVCDWASRLLTTSRLRYLSCHGQIGSSSLCHLSRFCLAKRQKRDHPESSPYCCTVWWREKTWPDFRMTRPSWYPPWVGWQILFTRSNWPVEGPLQGSWIKVEWARQPWIRCSSPIESCYRLGRWKPKPPPATSPPLLSHCCNSSEWASLCFPSYRTDRGQGCRSWTCQRHDWRASSWELFQWHSASTLGHSGRKASRWGMVFGLSWSACWMGSPRLSPNWEARTVALAQLGRPMTVSYRRSPSTSEPPFLLELPPSYAEFQLAF